MNNEETSNTSKTASQLIDERIADLGDWRGEMFARIRRLVKETLPDAIEEWKWRGTPVWSSHRMVCTGETYKDIVKITFAKGAALDDPSSCSIPVSKETPASHRFT
jgi:hypothetical protein